MSRNRMVRRLGFLVLLVACVLSTNQLPATEQGSGETSDGDTPVAAANVLVALDILEGALGPGSAESEASPFQPPGQGGSPPGQQ